MLLQNQMMWTMDDAILLRQQANFTDRVFTHFALLDLKNLANDNTCSVSSPCLYKRCKCFFILEV